jgi:hypothetical protein
MRIVSLTILISVLVHGTAVAAQQSDSNTQPTAAKTDSKQDAGTNTDVGVSKSHEDQTGHHARKCGGIKRPNGREKKKR